jgi:hypothetical protein
MSDEQEHRRDPAGRGSEPDETRPFSPAADDDDATRVGQSHPDGGPRSSDAWVFDRPENSSEHRRDDDPTAVTPPRDATSVMPPVGGDASWGAAEAPWSGRAEVRPPRPGEYTSTDWATEPPSEPRGKWWMPIVIGIAGLLLLALLGWGIWLIARAQGNDDTPAPVTTATAPAPAATRPTTPPTSAAPTTQPTTTEPTPSAVTIPALRGLSQDEARQALSRRGLSSRLRFLSSTDAPPGTVIDSDPAEGQEVPPDTVVTLVIAAEPRTSPSPSSTSTANQPGDD